MKMKNDINGSTWKKWDLHVHTPESIVHNYPGGNEAAWDAFVADIESLPPDYKVIGINDYLFVDGYERVLRLKKEGRLANIDLFLPVVELRLDKFGGVVKSGKSGYTQSSWSRINLHIIFDQIEPDLIRQQFLAAISKDYKLTPGSSGVWGGVITRDNVESLGKAIIESVSADKRGDFGSPLKEGFNNLNVSFDAVKDALRNPYFNGKHIIALGKTEWEDLKWDDHTIAEKKTLINEAHLVFTAAESPEAYAKARKKLDESNVNANLLDCSDAHHLSSSGEKDRVGNCFTWIKAEAKFHGLLQALNEFEDRVYVGDIPPKHQLVAQNRTKFIKSVRVYKKPGSALVEPWFDVDLPLNSDLVAIIGNKGSGKSALSDIIALAGNTKNYESFSFLKNTRFRNPRARFAHNFIASLTWHDGSETSRELDKDPDTSAVERVKYLPQSYLETLCNELGEGGSSTFDIELRKIIYSHVPEEDRLGQSSMDDLLQFKVAEINAAKKSIASEISKINAEITRSERRLAPDFKKGLEEHLEAKRNELKALESVKPEVIEDPNASIAAAEESKQAAAEIEKLELGAQALQKEENDLRDLKASEAKRLALIKRVNQAIANHRNQHELFILELDKLLMVADLGFAAKDLVSLEIKVDSLKTLAIRVSEEINNADIKLQSQESDSLYRRREEVVASIAVAKSKLDNKQRQYVHFKEEFLKWEKAKADICGPVSKVGTIDWIEAEIQSLDKLPEQVAQLRAKRLELVKGIHGQIKAMVDEYRRLYEPVQIFVKSIEKMEMALPLNFEVTIEESGFKEQFLGRINRQAKGSFAGVEESGHRIRALMQEADFSSSEDALAFVEKIDDMLHYDRRYDGDREVKLLDQLRKGVDAEDVLDYIYQLEYLAPRYSLTYGDQEICHLSPGERGLLLLVFYLLVDKDSIPIVIDQPEENLDNQTIYKILVKCIKRAKERRQVIMVTHNPNLAVVCDAEQIIYAHCEKTESRFNYYAGAIEHPVIKDTVVKILEGTEPAFKNRQSKYRLQ
jgi:ABC-type lipoprotein export system ATPase subunit